MKGTEASWLVHSTEFKVANLVALAYMHLQRGCYGLVKVFLPKHGKKNAMNAGCKTFKPSSMTRHENLPDDKHGKKFKTTAITNYVLFVEIFMAHLFTQMAHNFPLPWAIGSLPWVPEVFFSLGATEKNSEKKTSGTNGSQPHHADANFL